MMDEREEWIQKYIQNQIEGMVFATTQERELIMQKLREQAEMYLQMHQGLSYEVEESCLPQLRLVQQ